MSTRDIHDQLQELYGIEMYAEIVSKITDKILLEAKEWQTQVQRCVIHMLWNSFKYVNYDDLKKFSSDFKAVYSAPKEVAALLGLDAVHEKWEKKYPYAIRNWEV